MATRTEMPNQDIRKRGTCTIFNVASVKRPPWLGNKMAIKREANT